MSISGVRAMFEMAQGMKHPIDLSLGMPDYDPPASVRNAAIAAIRKGYNKYTPTSGILSLRERIAQKLKEENRVHTVADNVLVTCAVSGALSIILTTLVDAGDEVILFDPYFVGYQQLILQNGGVPVYVKTDEHFQPDLVDLGRKLTKRTVAILINSPNNPTGAVYSRKTLQAIAKIAASKKIPVVSDEIYEKFCYDAKHVSIASMYDRTIVVNGLSKSHGITGWRIGYCAGPAEIINQARKVQQYSFVCAPSPFQYAALAAFDCSVTKHVAAYRKHRDVFFSAIKKVFPIQKSQGAFYAFIPYPYEGDRFMKQCIAHELLVVPGKVFSQNNIHFRASFAAKNRVLRAAGRLLCEIARSDA